MKKKILIVEDEETIASTIKAYLENENYTVLTAYNGIDALKIFEESDPHLIVLDLNLPLMSGEEVCKKVRKTSSVPIIMLSAKINEESRLNGFEIGTDDYMTKPFSPRELIARINSIFKRLDNKVIDILTIDNLTINFDASIVYKDGVQVNLTPSEFKILKTLAKNPKRTYSREDLLNILSDDSYELYERIIDAHIKNIRSKIECDSYKYIITVRGFGYKFKER